MQENINHDHHKKTYHIKPMMFASFMVRYPIFCLLVFISPFIVITVLLFQSSPLIVLDASYNQFRSDNDITSIHDDAFKAAIKVNATSSIISRANNPQSNHLDPMKTTLLQNQEQHNSDLRIQDETEVTYCGYKENELYTHHSYLAQLQYKQSSPHKNQNRDVAHTNPNMFSVHGLSVPDWFTINAEERKSQETQRFAMNEYIRKPIASAGIILIEFDYITNKKNV